MSRGDFINGKFQAVSEADGQIKDISPADLSDVIMTSAFSHMNIDLACEVAKTAFLPWARLSADERKSYLLKVREQFDLRSAFTTAISMSFISMVTMEIAMNISDFIVTGGKAAFNTPQYWLAFIIASLVGFLAPLPYNYYKLKKYNKACH